MNRLISSICLLSLTVTATAGEVATGGAANAPRLSPVERQERLNRIVEQKAGGFVERPDSSKGAITYVNCQGKAPRAWIDESMTYLRETMRFVVDYKEGSFDLKNPSPGDGVTLFIVDDETLPVILHAPDSRWTLVNIAPIARERRPAFFEARTKKELSRAVAYLCGAGSSRYERSLMRGIRDISELDKNANYEIPVDVVQRFRPYLEQLGLKPVYRASYHTACEQGWAPQPTNEVQKAIWDKIHTLPTNPITIKYDPAKGR